MRENSFGGKDSLGETKDYILRTKAKRINKSDVVRHLQGISRLNTTHKTIMDLIDEGKINPIKDNPRSQTHYLTINESNEFNKIYNTLSEIEIIINTMDERINEISKRPEIEKIPKNKRDIYRYHFEQTFLIELFMTFVINLIRINRMKTQKDTEILYAKIINLMLKMAQRFSKPLSWDLLETGHIENLRGLLNDDNLPRFLNGELV
ncbi:MAG TPA: hypothetical protein VFG90_11820 [Nitrososphaeraceae archaeon]|nr:hypothetical protein [Nitrososphaeraceae archaeon]